MKKTIICLTLSLIICLPCFAQISASQMQRNEELLEKEQQLRALLEQMDKIYIKEIIVKGATLLNQDEIKQITAAFINHWLSQEDFQQMDGLFIKAYSRKGHPEWPTDIQYSIEEDILTIDIKEQLFKGKE